MEVVKMELQGMHSTVREAEYLVRQAQEKAMAGDHASAENYLKKAIDKYPRYAEAYTLLGNCQDCQGKPKMRSHPMTKHYRSIPAMQKRGLTKE